MRGRERENAVTPRVPAQAVGPDRGLGLELRLWETVLCAQPHLLN